MWFCYQKLSKPLNMSDESPSAAQLDELTENSIKIDEKFLITLTKNDNKSIEREAKLNCKIIKFSSEFTIDEVLTTIGALDPTEYPNLFIFIIENQNLKFTAENKEEKPEKFQEKLNKFGSNRPLIIQQTSKDENVTKIYYKRENSTQIVVIDQHFQNSSSRQAILISLVDGELGQLEMEFLKRLSNIQDDSLILRFMRTLDMQEELFETMILRAAKSRSKAELLAVLDALFEGEGRILNNRAQKYLKNVFKSTGNDKDDSPCKKSTKSKNATSVLLTAVENKNTEVIDYLITYCSHLIQQLPFEHQVRISTAAFETNQIDVLCDLLEISDFPFPQNFKEDPEVHQKLYEIAVERKDFKLAVEEENFVKIDNFIDKKPSLKFTYNPENKSAMKQAMDLKKFNVYFYLKSFGFYATEFDSLEKVLSKEDLEIAKKSATKQRIKNVSEAQCDANNSIMLLCTRSLIHNRRISKEQDAEYRKKIRKWFEAIYKIAPEMLDAAAASDKLKIIFDFESMLVRILI